MKKGTVWVFGALVLILVALVIFMPSYGWKLRAWLAPRGGATEGGAQQELAAKNQALQAQIAELQMIQGQIPSMPSSSIRAMVYSQYPLNFKDQILVSAGANEGVSVGRAVTFQGIFIGNVAQVFPDSALVETLFDSDFKMPVRIGAGGYDALLKGSASPIAVSIAKSAPLEAGDIVYTAAAGIPYALPVAIVSATTTSPDDLFQEASLNFIYDVNNIQTVLILK